MTSPTGNVCPPSSADNCVRLLLKNALSDQFKAPVARDGRPDAVNWGAWSSYFRARVAEDCSMLTSVFLNTYSHIFQRDEVTGEIRVQLALKLCRNGRCSTEKGCEDLHYCRFFLFGPSSCRNGDACRFGHDLTSDHNSRLLRHYRLDQLTVAEVGRLLRISGATEVPPIAAVSVTSRPSNNLPKICIFYNGKKGCQRGAQCWDLHVCSHHVQGTCSFNAKCTKSHDLYSGQPRDVLLKRCVSFGGPHGDLILELRAAMNAAATSGHQVADHDKVTEVPPIAAASVTSRPSKSLPKICTFYNGKKGCQRGAQCWDLHVCSHHVQGTCSFKAKCKKSHDLYSGQPRDVLLKQCVSLGGPQEDLIIKLRVAMNAAAASGDKVTDHEEVHVAIRNTTAAPLQLWRPPFKSGPPTAAASKHAGMLNDSFVTSSTSLQKLSRMQTVSIMDARKKPKICIYQLRGLCRYGVDCNKFHSEQRVSFQWQWAAPIVDGMPIVWNSFDRKTNWTIEKDFSQPENDLSSAAADDDGRTFVIDFTAGTVSGDLRGTVRRLCTDSVSSLVYPSRRFATLWKWYWQGTDGSWTTYDESDDIELHHKTNNPEYRPPSKDYWIDMKQRLHVETTDVGARRPVKRRPFFFGITNDVNNSSCLFEPASQQVSVDEGLTAAALGVANLQLIRSPSTPCVSIPENWSQPDDQQQEQHGFQLVDVPKDGATAAEFELIRKLFAATLPNEAIRSLKRIQNVELWEDFSRYRSKLEKKRVGRDPIAVRQLFHGTASKYVDAICQQGFDWRLSGTSAGTVYGSGSYFARDAKYSKSYCQRGDKMFVVQVIIGDFTVGKRTYTRPPAKDAALPLHVQELYDSCVNNVDNPSIFVVFDRHQAYPEYILEFQ